MRTFSKPRTTSTMRSRESIVSWETFWILRGRCGSTSSPTDVNAVCRRAAQSVVVGEKAPRLALRLDEELPEIVTDGERLGMALVNVLANARDAVVGRSGNGGSDIELKTECSGKDAVAIVVRDHGVGIAQQDLPKIFEPYFTGKRTGTGLGLAITKNIIESLGGTVTARSNATDGTEIRFDLFRAE